MIVCDFFALSGTYPSGMHKFAFNSKSEATIAGSNKSPIGKHDLQFCGGHMCDPGVMLAIYVAHRCLVINFPSISLVHSRSAHTQSFRHSTPHHSLRADHGTKSGIHLHT